MPVCAAKGNDKGKVEGLVKYARALTPIPQAASHADLNAMLAARCRARQGDHAGRHTTTIGDCASLDWSAAITAFEAARQLALRPL